MKNNILENDLYQKSLNKALFFLKFRARSKKEVEDYLKKYLQKQKIPQNTSEKTIKMVIDRLIDLDFINDRNFLSLWVEKRYKTNPKGRKVILYELKQKGIAEEIVEQVLDSEMSKYSENEVIRELLGKIEGRYKHLPYLKRREKSVNFIVRRGFSFSKAISLVDEMLKKGVE